MRVAGQQNPAPQILQRRMLRHALHQQLAQPVPAMRVQHEHIAEIRNRGKIADYAGQPDCAPLPS